MEVMSHPDFLTWFQLAASLLTVTFTALISLFLWRYTHRKDKLDLLVSRWNKQQEFNFHILNSDNAIVDFEKLVYGSERKVDVKEAKRYTYLFVILNFIQTNWLAMKLGILTKKEYKEQAIPTLSLVARNKEVIVYLLNERGYSKEFMREIELLLKEATPPKPPKALKDFDS